MRGQATLASRVDTTFCDLLSQLLLREKGCRESCLMKLPLMESRVRKGVLLHHFAVSVSLSVAVAVSRLLPRETQGDARLRRLIFDSKQP